ncbi:MAG: hypothetical protein KGV44_03170 [Flavobacteriaceae bacterium]|nr:hypothetical protein [Flavobacteriaceae bacterium]
MKRSRSFRKLRFVVKRRIEASIFLVVFFGFFGFLSSRMGVANMLNTIMNTAWDLLMNTVFYIMGITVLSGALGRLFIEFGVVRLLEIILKPFMRPLFNLPGVAVLAGLMTFFSDNPAIISLANNKNYRSYFTKVELISLTNFGTAFGMGLIVITFMSGFGYFSSAMVGVAGAVIGAIVATRLMQWLIRNADEIKEDNDNVNTSTETKVSYKTKGSVFIRFLNSILDGGKEGVSLGLAIIPGVLIISSLVMIMTFGPKDATVGYQGLAYEGVPVLPQVAGQIWWLFKGLFGFQYSELIAFPITSLGSVGAALSLMKSFVAKGMIGANEVAVFTAMGMCWSGYLSTHTAMLDSLNFRNLTSKDLFAQAVGGIVAGTFAHYLYVLIHYFGVL